MELKWMKGSKQGTVPDSEKPEQENNTMQSNASEQAESAEMKGQPGEEKKMPEKPARKKYMYLALNREGEVILDKDTNRPIMSNVSEEGGSISWPDKYSWNDHKNFSTDTALRVEVPEAKGKEKKREVRQEAQKKLRSMADDKILEETKKMCSGGAAGTAAKLPEAKPEESKEAQAQPAVKAEADTKRQNSACNQEHKPAAEAQKSGFASKQENEETKEAAAMIKETEKRLSQDIDRAVEDILGTIARSDKDTAANVRSSVEAQGKTADERTKKYIQTAVSMVGQKTQKASEDVIHRVNDTGRSISDTQDKILSRVNSVGKRVGELGESVESIEGDLHKLDQLDEIAELLRNKGLNISMEFPPVNAEEEDIVNLVRYAQKITEQLGYAARNLIRKQEAFRSQAESNANEQKMMAQKIEKAYSDGISEGQKLVVKQLLSKYEDVDTIKDSQESYVHVIWTMLTELGVVIDGEGQYEKGNVIELSLEDIERMMATYSKLEGAGRYKVVRTGLSLHGEIISAAQFEKAVEAEENQEKAAEEPSADGSAAKEPSTDNAEQNTVQEENPSEQ